MVIIRKLCHSNCAKYRIRIALLRSCIGILYSCFSIVVVNGSAAMAVANRVILTPGRLARALTSSHSDDRLLLFTLCMVMCRFMSTLCILLDRQRWQYKAGWRAAQPSSWITPVPDSYSSQTKSHFFHPDFYRKSRRSFYLRFEPIVKIISVISQ